MMMEEQRDRSREEIKEMDRVKKSVESLLEQLKVEGLTTNPVDGAGQISGQDPAKDKTPKNKRTQDEVKRIWDLLEEFREE